MNEFATPFRNCHRRCGKTGVIIALFLAIITILALLVFVFLWQTSPTFPVITIPSPNAFEEFVRIGREVSNVPDELQAEDPKAIREYIESNSSHLVALQGLLDRDFAVPVEMSKDSFDVELERLSPTRQAFRLLANHAKLSQLENRNEDAASDFVDLMVLARKTCYGGLVVNRQVSMAYERLAWNGLADLAPELSAANKREIVQRLDSLPEIENGATLMQRDLAIGTLRIGRLRAKLGEEMSKATFARQEALEAELREYGKIARKAFE